ncbi:MAG TPA: triose-phosphate isomerase, partial [Thermoanaerobaculia bacterium]
TPAESVEVIIAPPFPFLDEVKSHIEKQRLPISLGAQNCHDEVGGAYTGEVSGEMLRRAGAAYVIVGHSERRTIFEESDAFIGRKIVAARNAGLIPILCVGEDERTRASGATLPLLDRQLRGALEIAGPGKLLVAYEPVWAVGTGRIATPQVVSEAHKLIRDLVRRLAGERPPVLYGGSVTPDNVDELAGLEEVAGFLVGGASLDGVKFRGIHQALAGPVSEGERRR